MLKTLIKNKLTTKDSKKCKIPFFFCLRHAPKLNKNRKSSLFNYCKHVVYLPESIIFCVFLISNQGRYNLTLGYLNLAVLKPIIFCA